MTANRIYRVLVAIILSIVFGAIISNCNAQSKRDSSSVVVSVKAKLAETQKAKQTMIDNFERDPNWVWLSSQEEIWEALNVAGQDSVKVKK